MNSRERSSPLPSLPRGISASSGTSSSPYRLDSSSISFTSRGSFTVSMKITRARSMIPATAQKKGV